MKNDSQSSSSESQSKAESASARRAAYRSGLRQTSPNWLRSAASCLVPHMGLGLLALGLSSSGCSAGGGETDGAPEFPASNTAARIYPPLAGAPSTPNGGAAATGTTNAQRPATTNAAATPPSGAQNQAGNAGAAGAANAGGAAEGNPDIANNVEPAADDEVDDGDEAEDSDDDGADDDGDDDDGDDDDGDDDDGDDDDDDGANAGGGAQPGNPVTPPAGAAVTFTATIHPILVQECARCHSSGGLPRFAQANAAAAFDIAVSNRNQIVRLIQNGEMPADTCSGAPGSQGCVSVANLTLIQQWIAAGTPE